VGKTPNCLIEVVSPQFDHVELYEFSWTEFSLKSRSENHQANPYTEKTIIFTLQTISSRIPQQKFVELLSNGLSITILGDNDFYSQWDQLMHQHLPVSSQSLASLPKFMPAWKSSLSTMKKTGLGSSAALTTSLVACLLSYFNVIKLPLSVQGATPEDLSLVHNLAQFCHCMAQGKIGSGFDVSSATYGSQKYIRFSKEVLEPIMQEKVETQQLVDVVSKTWDNQVTSFSLPPGMRLLLGDVSKGSNTPGMVAKILKWQAQSPEAVDLIKELDDRNEEVERHFLTLHRIAKDNNEAYTAGIKEAANIVASKWNSLANNEVAKVLVSLRTAFLEVRRLLKKMGESADVEVEPDSQSILSDATMKIPGVLIAGVPGAGGYDAIFAILLNQESLLQVEELWTERFALPLILREDAKGVAREPVPEEAKAVSASLTTDTQKSWGDDYTMFATLGAATAVLFGYFLYSHSS
jgi:phosphomevalonate kinase